jgi:hypothetical protein
MIKLDEHIVELEGKQYIPADIAIQAVIEAMNAGQKLTDALKDINKGYTDLQND